MTDKIIVKHAKENNLQDVSLEIPKDELVVFTGVSGSGKSSLAFDTIFAEGQRRYVESLSVYARQFLGQMDKPNVESIDGLSPAISIDQKTTSNNPRSTVGTVTEIYDYLRLLYARIGTPHCPKCGREIKPQSIDEIVNSILKMKEGTKIQLLAPVVKGKKGEYKNLLSGLQQEGFVRVKIDGEIFSLDEDEIELTKTKKHDISVVVDRLVIKPSIQSRLTDSISIALKAANGIVIVNNAETNEDITYSEKFACEYCNLSFEELAPRTFSFNSPYGACEDCSGLGADFIVDADLVVPDDTLSINDGAIYPWAKSSTDYYKDLLFSVCKHFGIDMNIPFKDLPEEDKNIILYGSEDVIKITVKQFGTNRYESRYTKYVGVIPYLEKKYHDTSADYWQEEIEKYMITKPCKKCGGARLKPFSLAVTVGDKNIYEFTKLSVEDAISFIETLYLELSDYKLQIAKQILDEVHARLNFLKDVGLGYLDLARMAGTLSGGEAQRIRLATQIGSGLSGVLYVLDEPSIGLHQRDNDRLIKTLLKLRNLGNTLIVVEHDEDTIRQADYIVDIGPKAGAYGGRIIAQGSIDDIINEDVSITGKYLSGERYIPIPKKTREGNGHHLIIEGATKNNLKNINVDIPLGKIVVLTGVSGSGKSTLMQDVLYEFAIHKLLKNKPKPQGIKDIKGFENIDKVINIDQSPIGRTPRSNPATYTDVFTHIRALFAKTNEAKVRGYNQGQFSFNVKGGRCEACKGDGLMKIEMNFLSDVYVKCDVCKGKRYNHETLEVKYKGKSISDVLEMSVGEALEFFDGIPAIKKRLQTLYDVGLDYIKLGQSSTTLSGGEAQRIKLASELNKKATGKTLYLMDEPSVGLHWADLDKLIQIIQKLADNGNTILIIEHNMDLIKIADYIIDLGPEGGNGGGTVVATGTPKEIANCPNSYTGQYLKKYLNIK